MVTVKLVLTGVAAANVVLPACVAWMVHVPAEIRFTVDPATVQTAGVVEAKVIGSPELAVALTLNEAVPKG